MIKRILILGLSLSFLVSCTDNEDTYRLDPTNTNANTASIPNARNLEIPRIDENSGKIISHYASGILNFTLDWHADKKHSRWVAFTFTRESAQKNWNRNDWEYTSWEGDPFQTDPMLLPGERTELEDYSRDGYDRGHLCASEDRVNSKDCNEQTFYLSNMSPQISSFNQKDWSKLEELVRNWGRSNSFRDTLFVVKGGTIRAGQTMSPNKHGVTVPKYYFMAVMCKHSSTYKAIGFWVEHKSYGGNPDLKKWAVSIDRLEQLTGIDFFCNLPDRIETPIEQTFNINSWPGLK